MNFIGIIPARYASTRFPGKPLADIAGKPMIQRVYEQASKALRNVFVATDDKRIYDAVIAFGGKVIMTSEHHQSGTDRCMEAAEKALNEMNLEFDVVINIQGDEPFVNPEQIEQLKSCFIIEESQIATLIKKFKPEENIQNPNSPKVIINNNNEAIYFSRSVIPFIRNKEAKEWQTTHTFFKHIGLYAYRFDVLKEITALPQSTLELAESLEQLRWIENSYRIKTRETKTESIAIDTPEDLDKLIDAGLI